MSEIKVPIVKVRPNPYQPETRVNVSEADAERLGKSILSFGMILTPVGRRTNGFFEMGDGWLRLKGHAWLVDHGHVEFQEMRFDERDLTDQQMADLVIEANKERKDLNPIEEAQFYARYIKDFGVTETALAEKYNVSQGEIANTIRLLELPENVKDSIISQEISPTHGRQLLRLNALPKLQNQFLETVTKDHWSVSQLDSQINRKLWDSSKPLAKSEGRGPLFDAIECAKCVSAITVANPWGDQKKQLRCTNEKCWDKKQEAAEKAKEAKDKKKLDKKVAGQKVLSHKELPYNSYEHMENYTNVLDNPAECVKCTKRALYQYDSDSKGEPDKVCLDPKCYRVKKTKHTKAENKSKREQEKELTARLGKIFENTKKNRYVCLVVAARYMLKHIESNVRDEVASMFSDLPKHSNGRLSQDALRARVVNMAEPEVVKLLNAMVISQSRHQGGYSQFSTELKEDVLLDIAILEGTYEARAAEIKAFQEANCLGCGNANAELVHTGEPCCTYTYNRKIKDGVCENSPVQRQAKDKAREQKATAAEAAKKDKPAKGAEVTKKQGTGGAAAPPAPPVYKLEKRGRSYIALDAQGHVIAESDDQGKANILAAAYFEPVATKLNPSSGTGEYRLNHTYRIIPKTHKANYESDVIAQDLATAITALGLAAADVKEAKVWKSSGKVGTGGYVSAGWSKCTEPLESVVNVKTDEQELLDFQFRNCDSCYYADQPKVGTGQPCCTFITTPHIVDGKCLTRKIKGAEAQLEAAVEARESGLDDVLQELGAEAGDDE